MYKFIIFRSRTTFLSFSLDSVLFLALLSMILLIFMRDRTDPWLIFYTEFQAVEFQPVTGGAMFLIFYFFLLASKNSSPYRSSVSLTVPFYFILNAMFDKKKSLGVYGQLCITFWLTFASILIFLAISFKFWLEISPSDQLEVARIYYIFAILSFFFSYIFAESRVTQ